MRWLTCSCVVSMKSSCGRSRSGPAHTDAVPRPNIERSWLPRWPGDAHAGRTETSLQLAAYRYCEFWQPSKGVEEPMPEVDTVYVAHVKADVVDMLPVVANQEVFRQFLYLLSVWRDDEKVKEWPRIGSPVRPGEESTYE